MRCSRSKGKLEEELIGGKRRMIATYSHGGRIVLSKLV